MLHFATGNAEDDKTDAPFSLFRIIKHRDEAYTSVEFVMKNVLLGSLLIVIGLVAPKDEGNNAETNA